MDLAPEVDVNGLNAPSEPVAVHVVAVRVLPGGRWGGKEIWPKPNAIAWEVEPRQLAGS